MVGPYKSFFLIGQHGTGKSTLGKILEEKFGLHHWSLGDLGRHARKHHNPEGLPTDLLIELAAHTPGSTYGVRLTRLIGAAIERNANTRHMVYDGFPSEPLHVAMCPPNALFVHLTCESRELRLNQRAMDTERKWTPGLQSERDNTLPAVIQTVRSSNKRLMRLSNDGSVTALRLLATTLWDFTTS